MTPAPRNSPKKAKYCLRCREEHPPTAKTCGQCGGPLVPKVVRAK